jgi:hypothetical protein
MKMMAAERREPEQNRALTADQRRWIYRHRENRDPLPEATVYIGALKPESKNWLQYAPSPMLAVNNGSLEDAGAFAFQGTLMLEQLVLTVVAPC